MYGKTMQNISNGSRASPHVPSYRSVAEPWCALYDYPERFANGTFPMWKGGHHLTVKRWVKTPHEGRTNMKWIEIWHSNSYAIFCWLECLHLFSELRSHFLWFVKIPHVWLVKLNSNCLLEFETRSLVKFWVFALIKSKFSMIFAHKI